MFTKIKNIFCPPKSIIKHPIKFFIRGIIYRFVVGWLIFIPLSYLIPKNRKTILVIGRNEGRFVDNAKYFFLYLNTLNEKVDYYFLTESKEIYERLSLEYGRRILFYPEWKSFCKLLRASVVVVDNLNWIGKFKYSITFNSKKVQLWHGCPLKKIELDNPREMERLKHPLLKMYASIIGRFPTYDLLISTSAFLTERAFLSAFHYKKIEDFGYPRNDLLFNPEASFEEIDPDIREKVSLAKREGRKIVLYTPTFRDTGGDAIKDNILDIQSLNKFAEKENLLFIFKFHPIGTYPENFDYKYILYFDKKADTYPLLPHIDLLITDYSSIYIDFMLLQKPIIFFNYDYDKYISKDRPLYLDYNEYTPGPKCKTQKELEESIANLFEGQELHFESERKKILDLMFSHQDGYSSKRIWLHIKNNFMKIT